MLLEHLLQVLSESFCVHFSLKHFRPSVLWPHVLLFFLLLAWTVEEEEMRCSYSSHSHLVFLLSDPCVL